MTKRMIIATLALVGVFVALYLALYKMGVIGHLACTIGGCEQVNTSRWATFLGAPVALWGVGFYVATFLVAFIGTMPRFEAERGISVVLMLMSTVGTMFTVWLTYLELAVIHAICQYCVISAIIVTCIWIVSLLEYWGPTRA